MPRLQVLFCYSLLLLFIAACQTEQPAKKDTEKTATAPTLSFNFQKVYKEESGILFNNKLTHNLQTKENLFDYDFFYNGAGVGVVDINNDGLKDIFFCGNQVPNKLYLNKGNFVFEDISETAQINTNKQWANGVTFADVNMDGWMDIYVSQGGPRNKAARNNLLFINQKDNTFKEAAKEYGLQDFGISTQAAFFDFDKDGDLDCIVNNENEYYGVSPRTFYKILSDKQKLQDNSSHLYENKNGKFVDITEKAGLLHPTFGLGLCVSDINNDNWLDIYIANDYYVPDALYINNKKGGFTDQIKKSTQQISFYGMGVDIADINQDNLQDIFVLDMASSDHVRSKTLMASMNVSKHNLLTKTLGLQSQYMFNSLQLNLGNNTFHNIAQTTGLSKTDWSWAGLIFDTNNDGNEDLYVTNGYRRYALDNDIKTKILQTKRRYKGRVPLEVKETIYNELPSEKLSNLLFQNNGNLHFKNTTATSGLSEPSFSNGAAYADLDNDGDLDLVINNIDTEAFLFKNNTSESKTVNYLRVVTKGKLSESFAKVAIYFDGKKVSKENKRVRGYLSAVDNNVHFGLGKTRSIDSVIVTWPSGATQKKQQLTANSTVTFNEDEATQTTAKKQHSTAPFFKPVANGIVYTHKENEFNDFQKEILLPFKQSTLGPFVTKGDANGDGKEDIYIGGALGQAGQLYLQTRDGFSESSIPAFENDKDYEDMEAVFIDIDNDQDQDLYVVSGGSEFHERAENLKDRLYRNNGKGVFTRVKDTEMDHYAISGKTVTKIDYDNDGDLDLIVGNRIKPQKYPLHEPSLIYENNNGVFTNKTAIVAPAFEHFGLVNKVIATDFNNDGWEDFIAVGEWTGIGLFVNNKGTFTNMAAESNLDTEKGWWYTVVETDVNNDGLKDYIVGNIGKNIKYKVSPIKPLRVYADDFDDNGTHDVVLSYKYNGLFVPARGKECSTQQMPFISKKMPSFNEFAHASLEDIYGDKIQTAYQREANQFKSLLLLNKGAGEFEKIALPNMAQTMPVLSGDTHDFNNDGYEDVLLIGNVHNTEVETPRLDNPYGLVLLSNQKDNYTVAGPEETGLYLTGNAKSIQLVFQKKQNKTFAIITNNNGKSQIFELKSKHIDAEKTNVKNN